MRPGYWALTQLPFSPCWRPTMLRWQSLGRRSWPRRDANWRSLLTHTHRYSQLCRGPGGKAVANRLYGGAS